MQSHKFEKLFKVVVNRLVLQTGSFGGEKWQSLYGTGQDEIAKFILEIQRLLKKQWKKEC